MLPHHLWLESQSLSDPPTASRFCRLGTQKPSSTPHPLCAALHRVDKEIQHMLENARLLAKAA